MSVVSFPAQGADLGGATGTAGADTDNVPGAVCGSSTGRIGPSLCVPSWGHQSHGMAEILKPLAVPLMTLSQKGLLHPPCRVLQNPTVPRACTIPAASSVPALPSSGPRRSCCLDMTMFGCF